jgi:cyclopropane fatty-acyl-phospholipid synthase-like methyltransferase
MLIGKTLRQLHSWCWETYLGVDTRGIVASVADGGVHYSPLPYYVIIKILDRLQLTFDDVLVDLGCGKGRVLSMACRRQLSRVVGVEINRDLLNIAAQNLRKIPRKRTHVELVEALAQHYPYDDATVIMMYNPFDRTTMEDVFAKVESSYQEKPRSITVAYANCAHEEPLKKLGWLHKVEEWPAHSVAGFPHRTSFWESEA